MESQRSQAALRDQNSQFHPFTSIVDLMADGPTVMESGTGIRVRDVDGNEYIDGMAGLWCVNLGYGRKEITQAIAKQSERLAFFHTFNGMSSDVVAECAEALLQRAPVPMSRVFFGASGSDANETQLKLIWYYNNLRGKPEKKKIIARWNAYHGSGVATASLTGLPGMHTLFDLPKGPIIHVSAPYYYRNAPEGMSEREFAAAAVPLILYAALLGSVAAPLLWMAGIARLGPERATVFFNMLPIVTASLAVLILGEPLYWSMLTGGLLVVVGVVLAEKSAKRA